MEDRVVVGNGEPGGPWTKDWKPMGTYYQKSFCDIITKEGKQIDNCWPNAGFMNPKEGEQIPYEEVNLVRLAKSRWKDG